MNKIYKNWLMIYFIATLFFIRVCIQDLNIHSNSKVSNVAVEKVISTDTNPVLAAGIVGSEVVAGFTLAEVLITLLIIGVVASIVIPALINDTQDSEYKIAYKKAFADVSQAFYRAKNNYEFIDNNNLENNLVSNIRTMENYFSVTKECTDSVAEGCWVDNCITGEKDCFWSVEDNQGKSVGFVDNAGRQWIRYKSTPTGWFVMLVDTNGNKKPNRLGRDRFPLLFVDNNNISFAKAPVKVVPPVDERNKVGAYCKFGNCFYTTWLK